MDVVQVAGGLELSVPEALERLECLMHLALLDVPPGALRYQINYD